MSVVESNIEKVSGCQYGGFGVTFCYQDVENFYCLFIDVQGWFWVIKRVDGVWSVIHDPEQSNRLVSGYERENTLRVESDSNSHRFDLFFNGSPGYTFYDNSFQGGYTGFAAEVLTQEYEKFPAMPVDVRAKRVLPAIKGPAEPSPPDGNYIEDTTPLLSWSTQEELVSFNVQLDNDRDFSDPLVVDKSDLSLPNYQIASPLEKGKTYYWRVKAKTRFNEWSDWGETWSFIVGNAPITNPIPSNGSVTPYISPLLDWNDVWGASGYHVQMNTDHDFTGTTVVDEDTSSVSQYQLPVSLMFNTTYYWHVMVRDADGAWGYWGNTWSFTVVNNWSVTFGGALDDYAVSQCPAQDGGAVVTGMTESFGSGWSDFLLAKLRYDGSLEWANCYGGTEYDHPDVLRATGDGGYMLAGHTGSFGIDATSNCWMLKLDQAGSIDWQYTYGGTILDTPNDIRETSDNGYIVAGYTQSFAPTGSLHTLLFKLSPNGTIEWSKVFGIPTADNVIARAIRQTGDGGYVVTGDIWYKNGLKGLYVIRLASNGTIVWQKRFGGTDLFLNIGGSILETGDGGFLAAGRTESFGSGGEDIWLLKLDENGDVTWAKTYGGTSDDSVEAMDEVYLSIDGTYTVVGTTLSFGADTHNGLIFRLDSDGNPIWSRMYGVGQSNVLVSLDQTQDGDFLAVGSSSATAGRDFWALRFHGEGSCGGLGTDVQLLVKTTNPIVVDPGIVGNDCALAQTDTTTVLPISVSPSWHRQVPN